MSFSRFALLAGVALLVPPVGQSQASDVGLPKTGDAARAMHVYKTPWCGCCSAWADRMAAAGFRVAITQVDDLARLRREAAIPEVVAGCHIATVGGYLLEGHVPVPAIEKLLSERPPVHGIAVPGMPAGSPGMGDDPAARYDVVTFGVGTAEGSVVFYEAGR